MPVSLDSHQVIEERNAYIDAQIEQGMQGLEAMPAMMGDGSLEYPLDDGEREKENAGKPGSLDTLSTRRERCTIRCASRSRSKHYASSTSHGGSVPL